MTGDYQLVQLAHGAKTLFSASYGEKMHPGLGPQAEAELLYVRQLRMVERLQRHAGEFVVWDVGLGAAANAIAALRATREIPGRLRLVSFDKTEEPLEFALQNGAALGYPAGYESQLGQLLRDQRVEFQNGRLAVTWEFILGDFPELLSKSEIKNSRLPPAPDAVLYDPFSPAKNPAMWTLRLFENVFGVLDPRRPCALATYSRSTLLRATLLLAGFHVGAGEATGLKEETTIAANTPDLVPRPLDLRWLARAARSDNAEPLREPAYRRRRLSPETLARLRRHPQFAADCH